MFHYKTVDEFTLELLKKLQSLRIFSQMRQVGGTSLALQSGHRKSVDIDSIIKNIHTYLIDEIKVDIVHYEYLWLKNKIVSDKIHLAAMKLSTIIGRAERVNGILKNEFNLDSTFKDLKTAQKAVRQAIKPIELYAA